MCQRVLPAIENIVNAMRQTSALQSYDIEHTITLSRLKNCTKSTMLYFLTFFLLNRNILMHFCAQHKYFWKYVWFAWVEHLHMVHTANCRTSRGQNMNSFPAWKELLSIDLQSSLIFVITCYCYQCPNYFLFLIIITSFFEYCFCESKYYITLMRWHRK